MNPLEIKVVCPVCDAPRRRPGYCSPACRRIGRQFGLRMDRDVEAEAAIRASLKRVKRVDLTVEVDRSGCTHKNSLAEFIHDYGCGNRAWGRNRFNSRPASRPAMACVDSVPESCSKNWRSSRNLAPNWHRLPTALINRNSYTGFQIRLQTCMFRN